MHILSTIVGGSPDNHRETLRSRFCGYRGNNNIYTVYNTNYKDKQMEISEKEYKKLLSAYKVQRKAQQKWSEKNKEKRKLYMKEWQQTHKEHLAEYRKKYKQMKLDNGEKQDNI